MPTGNLVGLAWTFLGVRVIRLGIVDDHPVFRLGLRRVFEREPDLEVAWESGTASEVLDLIAAHPVDVVLMDLNLGADEDALAVTRAIRDRHEMIKVVVISSSLDWEAAAASRDAGASGYLPKDLKIPDLVAAIRGLVAQVGRIEFRDMLTKQHSSGLSWVERQGLTRRERQVLGELRRGYTNREIAQRLNVSIPTVNKHVQQVLRKLGVRTRAQAVALLHAESAARLYQGSAPGPPKTGTRSTHGSSIKQVIA
jgi:DNA-binding NarL/FixJ family response regulator